MPKRLLVPQDSKLRDTWGRNNRKIPDRRCSECGKVFRPHRSSGKYCSRKCSWANNGGHNRQPETWWTDRKGYMSGRVWINGKHVFIRKHRWIMEQHIGRPLSKTEVVHHINEDKQDNRIENLEIIQFGNHSTNHNTTRIYKKGYKLNLTDEERKSRSERAKATRIWEHTKPKREV